MAGKTSTKRQRRLAAAARAQGEVCCEAPQKSASSSTCEAREESAPACSADGWSLQPVAATGSETWDCTVVQPPREAWQQQPDELERAVGDVFPVLMPLAPGSSALVLLQNVPSELCNVSMMEVVLQQAALEARIVECRDEDLMSGVGEVTLALPSFEMADLCILHFQGCQWGVAGTNLLARFVGVHEEEPVHSISLGGIPFDAADPLVSVYSMQIERNIERLLGALLEPSSEGDKGRRSKQRTWKKAPKALEPVTECPRERPAPQPATEALPASSTEAHDWAFPAEGFPIELLSTGDAPEGLTERSVWAGNTCAGGAGAMCASLGASDLGAPLLIGNCGEGSFGEVCEVELQDAARKECNESVSTEEGTGLSGTSEAELSEFLVPLAM